MKSILIIVFISTGISMHAARDQQSQPKKYVKGQKFEHVGEFNIPKESINESKSLVFQKQTGLRCSTKEITLKRTKKARPETEEEAEAFQEKLRQMIAKQQLNKK